MSRVGPRICKATQVDCSSGRVVEGRDWLGHIFFLFLSISHLLSIYYMPGWLWINSCNNNCYYTLHMCQARFTELFTCRLVY